MTRATPTRRVEKPLHPEVKVVYVKGAALSTLESQDVTPEKVGLKAWGLASIPQAWTKPFFVVSGEGTPTKEVLENALTISELANVDQLFIRSSGVDESLEERGSLVSVSCKPHQLLENIQQLRSSLDENDSEVHWVVQEFIKAEMKGHLSNERRIAKEKRDWVAEIEVSDGQIADWSRISIRTWRDNREPKESIPLRCDYRATYIDRLKEVARWAYERRIRIHFEWVWDGQTIYVVQADECDRINTGIDPKSLVKFPRKAQVIEEELKVFRLANASDFAHYRKLCNAKIYQDLGYTIVPFFVLDDPNELKLILEGGECSASLVHDLELLTKRPLVIRTDGADIPDARKAMLPRSDELRSDQIACQWLLNNFRSSINFSGDSGSLSQYKLCLIAHHFVPAVASAWCQARPDTRRVRIESLWGIPEGLYWYAYDAFDVDTKQLSVADRKERMPGNMLIRDRIRYKERFIAPDDNGAWVVHKTAADFDWKRSIKNEKWIREIAWASRRIAHKTGEPVVVMWLVDIPRGASSHQVLPWYHETWHSSGSPHKVDPPQKNPLSTNFLLKTRSDWDGMKKALQEGEPISRVTVLPTEPELVRDQDFASELAKFGREYKFVIELAGGILSHAYYMLSSAGCNVECIDLDNYVMGDDEIIFNKLVRDKIPENISSKGESVLLLKLKGEALIAALRRKLVEEALEVLDAKNNDQITEELADVKEVMLALIDRLEISLANVERSRKKKADDRGVFRKGLMLSRTTISSPLSIRDLGVDELVKEDPGEASKTISQIVEIPATEENLHTDRRLSNSNSVERFFQAQLPAYVDGIEPMRTTFSLDTPNGGTQEMLFEIKAERIGADVQLKVKLTYAPTQLKLNLN